MAQQPIAHSRSKSGREDPVSAHLADVAATAARFAEVFGAAEEARAAGLLHDLGKYGEVFGKRLSGAIRQVDHSSAGAWAALKRLELRGCASALCIQGHHIGLQQASKDSLTALDPARLRADHPQGFHLPDEDVDVLLGRLQADGLRLPDFRESIYHWPARSTVADMLDVRMLFSALVDADYIETEAHFQAQTPTEKIYRPAGPPLQPDRALASLLDHVAHLSSTTEAAAHVAELRSDLLNACLRAGDQEAGLFTLSAPTGAGKTLAMLAFALRHAIRHGLRRVVVVIPYLTIIEQTVRSYRQALAALGGDDFLQRYVLEHHSLAGTRRSGNPEDADSSSSGDERLLAENWDAPIVVTTSVQFLESLFANHPAPCRKLHRLAENVILLDEVQTLPVRLAVPTLGTLARLAERYGTSVTFATATQPAFDHLDATVAQYCGQRWRPREIVPQELGLFDRARRTRVEWPMPGERLSWQALGQGLVETPQVLCIVNLKRHALHLLELLQGADGLLHLSTNMCPAHRGYVLQQVHARLKTGEPCRLISTQCVEAGVDVDFPVVFRAWGPLDAIAQAAGRCNRNGLQAVGNVKVFIPEDTRSLYPDGAYQQAATVAQGLLRQRGVEGMDIHDEALFRQYYADLYAITSPENLGRQLLEAAQTQNFVEVDRLYRVINTDAINVLVPYDLPTYHALVDAARADGLTADWVARARPHAVSVFRPRRNAPITQWLEPVPVGTRRNASENWFIYLGEGHYDSLTGLRPPDSMECLIA